MNPSQKLKKELLKVMIEVNAHIIKSHLFKTDVTIELGGWEEERGCFVLCMPVFVVVVVVF